MRKRILGDVVSRALAQSATEPPDEDDWDKIKKQRDTLLAELKVVVTMLAFEAKIHEESGDAKRRSYVAPIRAQVERTNTIIAEVEAS
jgi:hypothetical protein